jgi:hypothetical protein
MLFKALFWWRAAAGGAVGWLIVCLKYAAKGRLRMLYELNKIAVTFRYTGTCVM